MSRLINMLGQKFSLLTVVDKGESTKLGATRWICRCDCGEMTVARGDELRSGMRVCCGCIGKYDKQWIKRSKEATNRVRGVRPPALDLKGRKFGWLTVVEWGINPAGRTQRHQWRCVCDCGGEVFSKTSKLQRGDIMSCGCRKPGVGVKWHGKSHTPEYKTWADMVYRCTNPKAESYANYGGRGITVCARWLECMENFIEDMGERPAGLSVDRINNDDGYHCGKCEECARNGWVANCRWATRKQQANNQRKRTRREKA